MWTSSSRSRQGSSKDSGLLETMCSVTQQGNGNLLSTYYVPGTVRPILRVPLPLNLLSAVLLQSPPGVSHLTPGGTPQACRPASLSGPHSAARGTFPEHTSSMALSAWTFRASGSDLAPDYLITCPSCSRYTLQTERFLSSTNPRLIHLLTPFQNDSTWFYKCEPD